MPVNDRFTGLALVTVTALALAGCAGGPSTQPPPPPSPTAVPDTSPPPTASVSLPSTASASPPPVSGEQGPWTDTVERVSTGVVRISTADCEGGGFTGSGFMVGDRFIVTNAHVIEGAADITVGRNALPAEVVGHSEEADLALLRVSEVLEGHVFAWGEEPRVAEEVVVLGYPLGAGFTVSRGVVSSLDADAAQFPDAVRYIQTDAAVNPGNSGGPLVTSEGEVAGVVSSRIEHTQDDRPVEGTSFALSLDDAERLVRNWSESPQQIPLTECPVDPEVPEPVEVGEVDVIVTSTHPGAGVLAQTLALHGNAINAGVYDVAYNLMTPRLQERVGDLQSWQEGLYTSFWRELVIEDVSGSENEFVVRARLRTEQAPEYGPEEQSCSVFANEYTLVFDEGSGTWRIDWAERLREPEPCS